jgi:hypothetical protein
MLVRLLLELFLVGTETLEDNVVGTLRKEVEFPFSLTLAQLPQHNAHPLPRTRELEDIEELELNNALIVRRLDTKDVLVATEEDESDISGGLNERGFVRRLSLVREETVFLRGEDGVAEGEVAEEVVEVLGLVRLLLLQVGVDFVVVEGGDDTFGELGLDAALFATVGGNAGGGIVGGRAREGLLGGRSVVAGRSRDSLVADVDLAVNGALTEEHGVLSEGTGLVGEDVLDLTEVVGEVPAASGGAAAVSLHVVVAPDETGLNETGELDGNIKRDRDDVLRAKQVSGEEEERKEKRREETHLESDESVSPSDDTIDVGVVVGAVVVEEPRGAFRVLVDLDVVVGESAHDGHEREEKEVEEAASVVEGTSALIEKERKERGRKERTPSGSSASRPSTAYSASRPSS